MKLIDNMLEEQIRHTKFKNINKMYIKHFTLKNISQLNEK